MQWESVIPARRKKEAVVTKLLEQFSEDLIQKVPGMEPVIGRDREIDMVIDIGRAKDGDWDYVQADIEAVRAACGAAKLKVIIETCLLTDDEKVKACQAAKRANADFVKTSTGFSKAGATVADVKLMRETVGPDMGVKASGGIHSRAEAEAMIAAGATRIGASSGIAIVTG